MKSEILREKRRKMITQFKEILLTSKDLQESSAKAEKHEGIVSRKQGLLDYTTKIPRVGIIFVVDICNENSLFDVFFYLSN